MAADIQAQALSWALDEIDKQRMGEEYGAALTWGPAPVQTPAGPRLVPSWQLMLTARNPVLKEGPLYHGPVAVGAPVPQEKAVREQVAAGMRQLRDLAASKLAGTNGHVQALARPGG